MYSFVKWFSFTLLFHTLFTILASFKYPFADVIFPERWLRLIRFLTEFRVSFRQRIHHSSGWRLEPFRARQTKTSTSSSTITTLVGDGGGASEPRAGCIDLTTNTAQHAVVLLLASAQMCHGKFIS